MSNKNEIDNAVNKVGDKITKTANEISKFCLSVTAIIVLIKNCLISGNCSALFTSIFGG